MSNQQATTTVAVQAVTGPVLNKDYQPLLDRLLKLMHEQMGERLLAVCLYGSLARGQARRGSDVDLFIVVQGEREETGRIWVAAHQALVATSEYEALVQRGIWPDLSPFIVTQAFLAAETPWLLLEVQDHGLILYDPQGVLADKLEEVRQRMRELGTKKVMMPDGSWYWDIKPDWKPGEVFEL